MRDVTDIRLDQLIMHVVNPRVDNGLVLSERVLPLTDDERLAKYFVDHVKNGLQDSAARAARFQEREGGPAAMICKDLLDGTADLVGGSQHLASHLHEIIAHDQRISTGILVVGFYHATMNGTERRYLTILKLDPSDVYRHTIDRDVDELQFVRLELEPGVLPTTRERLQKSAFIQPLLSGSEYDMLLLDRQSRSGGQAGATERASVARFFTGRFLGAEEAFDKRSRSHALYAAAVSAQNTLRETRQLSPGDEEALAQAILAMAHAPRINVVTWLDSLPLQPTQRAVVARMVDDRVPDREFEIDTVYLTQRMRKRRFVGDNNLRVEASSSMFDDIVTVTREQRNGRNVHIVTIVTEKWDELPR